MTNNTHNWVNTFNAPEYAGLQTSPEILAAIEELSGDEFDISGPDTCAAHTLWRDGVLLDADGKPIVTTKQVLAVAWTLADDDTDELFWGASTFRRGTSGMTKFASKKRAKSPS